MSLKFIVKNVKMKIEITEKKEFKLIAGLVEEVQNLHANLFPDVYKPFEYKGIEAAMETMFSNENCRVFIAKLNEETIGYMMLLIKEIPENAFHYSFKIIHIDQIAVSEKHQRNGVGEILMQKAETIAKEMNIDRLELDHLYDNAKAANFFQHKGFIPYRSKLFKLLN